MAAWLFSCSRSLPEINSGELCTKTLVWSCWRQTGSGCRASRVLLCKEGEGEGPVGGEVGGAGRGPGTWWAGATGCGVAPVMHPQGWTGTTVQATLLLTDLQGPPTLRAQSSRDAGRWDPRGAFTAPWGPSTGSSLSRLSLFPTSCCGQPSSTLRALASIPGRPQPAHPSSSEPPAAHLLQAPCLPPTHPTGEAGGPREVESTPSHTAGARSQAVVSEGLTQLAWTRPCCSVWPPFLARGRPTGEAGSGCESLLVDTVSLGHCLTFTQKFTSAAQLPMPQGPAE